MHEMIWKCALSVTCIVNPCAYHNRHSVISHLYQPLHGTMHALTDNGVCPTTTCTPIAATWEIPCIAKITFPVKSVVAYQKWAGAGARQTKFHWRF